MSVHGHMSVKELVHKGQNPQALQIVTAGPAHHQGFHGLHAMLNYLGPAALLVQALSGCLVCRLMLVAALQQRLKRQ